MKKSMLFFIFISLNALIAQAQMPENGGGGGGRGNNAIAPIEGEISGIILDSLSKKPVEFATVALQFRDFEKIISGGMTDDKGKFKLEKIPQGNYKLIVSFVGYQTKTLRNLKISTKNTTIKLGNILFRPDAILLNEVEIKGEAALVENKPDKIVYNAEKDLTSVGGDATDVLRKVPMLAVDLDGNVSLRGNSNIKVLINGKPSGIMASNLADALKTIPADQIKNVEVITSPSAKYDAEGTAGIINIITKKKNLSGYNGNVNVSSGTQNNRLNGNLSAKGEKLGFNAQGGGNYSWPKQGTSEYSRTSILGKDTTSLLNQNGKNTSNRLMGRGSMGVDYEINSKSTINSNINFNRFGNSSKSITDANNQVLAANIPFSTQTSTRNTTNNAQNAGFDWTTDYTKKFDKALQEFSTSAQWSHNKTLNDYTLNKSIVTGGETPQNERSNNNGKNDEITGQMDYTHPLTDKSSLEVGAKGIVRYISSDYEYLVFQNSSNSYLNDPKRSNVFSYNQNVYSGYSVLSFPIKTVNFKLGGRWEQTQINGDFQSTATTVKQDYGNFIPSLAISKNLGADGASMIKFNYSKRLQRPSLNYLNPFENASDPRNVSRGNPNLRPEFTDQFELGYSTFAKGASVNLSIYYRATKDNIESFQYIEPSGRSVTTFQNIGTSQSYGTNVFASVPFGKYVTLRGNFNVFSYSVKASADFGNISNNHIMWNGGVSGSAKLGNGISAEIFSHINSPRYTAQGKTPGFNMLNLGFKKEILDKKGSLGLSITNPFKANQDFITELKSSSFTSYSAYSVPFRSFNMSFSYRFGKIDAKMPSFMNGKRKSVNNDDLKKDSSNDN